MEIEGVWGTQLFRIVFNSCFCQLPEGILLAWDISGFNLLKMVGVAR